MFSYSQKVISVFLLLVWFVLSDFSVASAAQTPPTLQGNKWMSVSSSYMAVKQAYDSAKTGQIVFVPGGTSAWDSTLVITKAITLMGSGANLTKITNNNFSNKSIILISPLSDIPVRITGIYFDLFTPASSYRSAVLIQGNTSGIFGLTKIRIDNCTFNMGDHQVFWRGWAYGVVDHNKFINGDVSVMLVGDDSYAWARPMVPGTINAVYIDSNTFVADNNYGTGHVDQFIYHQEGARSVTRNNIFDTRKYTNDYPFFDSHGNWGTPITSFRGQPLIEIYNNTFQAYKTYLFIDLRGGSSLIYNNVFTTELSCSPSIIALWEEEAWKTGGPFCPSCPAAKAWPAQDQINNSFFWNNVFNGKSITSVSLSDTTEAKFIQENRDYWMHEPQSTGGRENYSGSPGGVMVFTSAGANAYFPYKHFDYPHPLCSHGPTSGEGLK